MKLTRNCCRLGKAFEDLRVNLDGQLLLLNEFQVTRLYDCMRPLRKRLTHESIREVDEPLAR